MEQEYRRCISCAQFKQSQGSNLWGKCTAPRPECTESCEECTASCQDTSFRSKMSYCDKTEQYQAILPVCTECIYFEKKETKDSSTGLCYKKSTPTVTGTLAYCKDFTRTISSTREDGSPAERRCGTCQDFTPSFVNDNGICRGDEAIVNAYKGFHCLSWRQRGASNNLFDILLEKGKP